MKIRDQTLGFIRFIKLSIFFFLNIVFSDFDRKQSREIPEQLEKLLIRIAQTGEPL